MVGTPTSEYVLDHARAQAILRELLRDESITVLQLVDESQRRARIETTFETRTLTRVAAKEPELLPDPPRDLTAMLWELPAKPSDPFVDEPCVIIEEPMTGAITDCPTCLAKGEHPCHKCGGTTRVQCESCRGVGHVDDGKGATKLCRFCNGEKFRACTICKLGTVPCKTCKASGKTFTIQRVTVSWLTHKENALVAAAPPEVALDGVPFVLTLAARNDQGPLGEEHLQQLDAPLRLAAQRLMKEHPLAQNARIRTQTLLVETTPVYLVTYRRKGHEHTVRFVGVPPRPLGLQPPTAVGWLYTAAASVIIASALAALYVTGIVGRH